MTLSATADIWGISGPTFLLAYLVIAAAVWVAGSHARRTLADPRPVGAAIDLTAHPHDVAYLNGGAELAVCSALGSMHVRGTITSSRGVVRAVGRLDPGTDELERAIHGTAHRAVLRRRLPVHRNVLAALAVAEERLVSAGLLLAEEQRLRIRRVGGWMLAVAGLGLVRLLAGVAEARPVGDLVVVLLAVAAVAAVQLASAPRRTRLGERTLADLRTEYQGLSPEVNPDRTVHGPADVALGVGIFGMGAPWAAAGGASDAGGSGVISSGADSGGGDSGGGCGG